MSAIRTERSRSEIIAFLLMTAVLVIAPFFVYPLFLMQAICFALFACSFNLLIGYVGLLSFGHALYFGWASYAAAHLAKVGTISIPFWFGGWKWLVIPLPPLSPELAIIGGALFATLLGLIAGALAIRRQGIYFAMITLALAQMMFFFALQAPFTHGEDGIQAVPRGKLFGLIDLNNQMTMYAVVLVIFLACFLLIYRIIHSPFGEVLKAIRENEPRAISLGYKTDRYKLAAFVLSAALDRRCRRDESDRVPAGVADRRALDDVGRSGADESRRRSWHHFRSGGRRLRHHLDAELSERARAMGHGHPGRDLRDLRMLFRRGIVGEWPISCASSSNRSQPIIRIQETPMSAEARLKELGIVLPSVPKPVANYVRSASSAAFSICPGRGRRTPTAIPGRQGADRGLG